MNPLMRQIKLNIQSCLEAIVDWDAYTYTNRAIDFMLTYAHDLLNKYDTAL